MQSRLSTEKSATVPRSHARQEELDSTVKMLRAWKVSSISPCVDDDWLRWCMIVVMGLQRVVIVVFVAAAAASAAVVEETIYSTVTV